MIFEIERLKIETVPFIQNTQSAIELKMDVRKNIDLETHLGKN